MEALKRFRLMAVRLSLLSTTVAAALVYLVDPVAAHGLLLGSVSGVLVFWVIAVRMARLASMQKGKVYSLSFGWTFLRITVYLLALYRAYSLDRVKLHGLVAAVAGLFIIRLVVVFLGFTGLDLKQEDD